MRVTMLHLIKKYLYDRSVFLHRVMQFLIFLLEKSRALKEYMYTVPRRMGVIQNKYKPLKEMHNKYKGKRCFIICTGPSLTIEDLEKLSDEYCFGMNSTCLCHDKTKWKSDFFSVQDVAVFRKINQAMLTTDNGTVFIPSGFTKVGQVLDSWIQYQTQGSYHIYEMRYKTRYYARFSDDCYISVYDGYSISYSIMQLAIYLGFDEIYLLGCDCSYLGKKQHFIEHGHCDVSFKEAPNKLFAAYNTALQYASTHNVKIFNATRGGALEIFPRVILEDVLKKKEKNKCYE